MLTISAITSFAALRGQPVVTADAIVVLGAGMDPDGTLHSSSLARAQKGIAYYQMGAAPHIHFSGGKADPDGLGAGDQMARLAQQAGVPSTAITTENQSQSTLQNALFSKPMLADATTFILVSDAFHLPRAKASFWWMGYRNIDLIYSQRFRRNDNGNIRSKILIREALAVWFNLGRAAVWSITGSQHNALLE